MAQYFNFSGIFLLLRLLRTIRKGLAFCLVYKFVLVLFIAGVLQGCSSSNVDESVVQVVSYSGYLSRGAGGTGFVIGDGSYIVTNHHVVENAIKSRYGNVSILTEGTGTKKYPARIRWYSASLDLAILRVPGFSAPALILNTGELEKTDTVKAVGFPGVADAIGSYDKSWAISTHTKGEVSRVFGSYRKRYGRHLKAIQHTATINKGNSGGPLLNNCGHVVGVNTWGATQGQGTFFSSHASELVRVLRDQKIPVSVTESRCNSSAGGGSIWIVVFSVVLSVITAVGIMLLFWPRARRVASEASHFIMPSRQYAEHEDTVLSKSTKFIDGTSFSSSTAYRLKDVSNSKSYAIDPAKVKRHSLVIGRTAGGHGIEVDEPGVSRQHAKISVSPSEPWRFYIEDLNSSNGTRVNGSKLNGNEQPVQLNSGDKIQIGNRTFVFSDASVKSETVHHSSFPVWVLRGNERETGAPILIELKRESMKDNQLVIGRSGSHCDIIVADPTVSSRGHAKIIFHNNEFQISDMGSTNGTLVDQQKLYEGGMNMVALEHNMVLRLGSLELRVERM